MVSGATQGAAGAGALTLNAGFISGTVTAADTGLGIAEACVAVGNFKARASTVTSVNGQWIVRLPSGGGYSVGVRDCSPTPTYYYGQRSGFHTLRIPDPHQVDIVLPRAGRITGTLTDRTTGLGVPQLVVTASGPSLVPGAKTDAAGHYSIGPLLAGNYTVEINDPTTVVVVNAARYPRQWYRDAFTAGSATNVPVVFGHDTDASEDLLPAASVSGVVTDAVTGLPVACAGVDVEEVGGFGGAFTLSDATGRYRATGLSPGTFIVSFRVNDTLCAPFTLGGPDRYHEQWWNNKPTPATADHVVLQPGQQRSGINAKLQPT